MEKATKAINAATEKYAELCFLAEYDFDMKNKLNTWNENAGMSVMYEIEIFAKIGLSPSMSTQIAEWVFKRMFLKSRYNTNSANTPRAETKICKAEMLSPNM
jgi:hypothetical protein